MRSTDTSDSEQLLKNLVHDLRQPLGNIETTIYLLLRTASPQTREQIRIIEHQVERASALLSEALSLGFHDLSYQEKNRMAEDPALAPIRERAEVKRLVWRRP